MNSDRELLKLAAKAAGIETLIAFGPVSDGYAPYWLNDPKRPEPRYWNPLEDDGDALRLAVKLGILIDTSDGCVNVQYMINGVARPISEYVFADIYAAIRRAVVQGAAEIGAKL